MKTSIILSFLFTITLNAFSQTPPLVKELTKENYPQGLSGRHIALWHSHGLHYEQSLDRWEWQRAQGFSNVEDIGTMPFVVSYLTPMLENAGAVVINARERDIQSRSYIVDTDKSSTSDARCILKGHWAKETSGYKYSEALTANQNPFEEGTYNITNTSETETATAVYLPNMGHADKGYYAVYISWANNPNNVSDVTYRVHHTGGITEFQVNQKMFGATWNYLGTFLFDENHAKVVVSNASKDEGVVTTDGVRFGGGMGIVARKPYKARAKDSDLSHSLWRTSGMPAYTEAARYYMQSTGIPDSIYTRSKNKNDYLDDYQGRPRWVNFLKKKGIPIDLSLAFHTDAGVTPNDSIIGTLAIYSTLGDTFTDGRSKLINGYMSGIIQNEVVRDIRTLYNPKWTQRELKDAAYSEAAATDVPSVLLELLSHQNLADMVYCKDPRFRFSAARSIYKGITRFLNDPDAIIQPLAPNSFAISKLNGQNIRLSWKETEDPLENTAKATSYHVYIREGENGYSSNYTCVTGSSSLDIELPELGKRYAFRVTSVNEGGESFPSEELSVCLFNTPKKPVLIVNGFTRTSAPSYFDLGPMAGFNWWEDEGVPEGYDMSFLGYQQDFDRSHPWIDDDNTGWGSSGTEGWGKIIKGNTHDFTSEQGKIYETLGISYISVSRSAFESIDFNPNNYRFIDLMFGKQRYTTNFPMGNTDFSVFSPALIAKLDTALQHKTPLLISGAYIGTDMSDKHDTAAIKFAASKLGYTWRTNHATKSGELYSTNAATKYINGTWKYPNTLDYVDSIGMPLMKIEAPDGIEPSSDAICILRYTPNNISAGTLLNKNGNRVIAIGIPIESILDDKQRASLMAQITAFFDESHKASVDNPEPVKAVKKKKRR